MMRILLIIVGEIVGIKREIMEKNEIKMKEKIEEEIKERNRHD